MKASRLLLSGISALFLAAACSEPDAPSDNRATVDVVVYLDTDGSGNLTAADQMLEGVDVTLFQGETEVGSATTNEFGHAFIENLPIGSYRVEIDGAPAGAALVTNSRPSAVVSAQADTVPVEFRFVYFPGVITGTIYRDDNTNNELDASDTRGAGLWVYLHASTGGAPGAKVDSVLTDNSGNYRFGRVVPGNYFLDFEQPTTITYTTTGPQAITVAPQSTASLNKTFTGSLILTIAQARAKAAGSAVAIEGIITTPPNVFTSGTGGVNSEIWVQDATGGIAVFSVLSSRAAELPLGQRVRVTGTRGANAGQIQITSPTVTALTGTGTISPVGITGAQLAARTHEGKLVTLSSFTVTTIGTGTSTSFDVNGTDAAGAPVRVRVNSATTGLTRTSFVVGQKYTITGIQTVFETGTPLVATPQIKPRFPSDVVLQPTSTPGRVVITEIMPDPSKVADDQGEYFEIYNAGGTAVDLTGWTFVDASASAVPHTITSMTIGAGEYRVFAINNVSTSNGGVPADQDYNGIFLNNSADRIVLKDAAGVTVDSVAYTAYTTGKAWGVIDPLADNANINGGNWALQTSTYGLGDFGTPRARNDGQVGPVPAIEAAASTTPAAALTRRARTLTTTRGSDQ